MHVLQYATALALASLMGELRVADDLEPGHLLAGGVRASDGRIEHLIREGCDRSSTFRALFREIQSSSWIVFVQSGSCEMPGISGCLLHRIGTFQQHKYLRIVLTATHRSHDEAIATIGHELQHAVEVVRDRDVARGSDIRDLYRRIGYVAQRTRAGEIYETAAARRAGARVLQQLTEKAGSDQDAAIIGQPGCAASSASSSAASLEPLHDRGHRQAVLRHAKKTSTRAGTQARSCNTP